MASVSPHRSPQRQASGPNGSAATEDSASPDQEELCEQLRRESEELCVLRQLHAAHDKALAALKLATDTYGKHALRLVPFYLVLVDIALRERQLQPAEELLSLVNWLLVKDRKTGGLGASGELLAAATSHAVPHETKNLFVIRMNKLYSLLHLEYGAFADGLQRAAHGAYHCSLLFGPDHLYTSELYFCLGLLFHRMQRAAARQQQQQQQAPYDAQREQQQRSHQNDSALGMLDKVVDIWYRFLTNPPEDTAAWMLAHQRLRIHEASAMLQQVVAIRQSTLGPTHVATGEALYTLGLLFLFLDDHAQAKASVTQALAIYVDALGSEHPSTLDVTSVLHQLDEAGV